MTQEDLISKFSKVEYPPDSTIPATTYSERDVLLDIILDNSQDYRRKFHGLIQIQFTLQGKHILFPDFDNILRRSDSVKDWWFLPPKINGNSVYKTEEEIEKFWKQLQNIYDSTILSKKPLAPQFIFCKLSESNALVDSLFSEMVFLPSRLSIIDEREPFYPRAYYYNFLRDYGIEKCWRFWVLNKAIVHYYHVIFAPKLIEKSNDREILRLSNRFPEYASAVRELAVLREELNKGHVGKEYVEKFMNLQATELKAEVLARKNASFLSYHLHQCRVCGFICPNIKIIKNRKGRDKKICNSQTCKKAWDSFKQQLPPIPDDLDGEMIQLSHL